MNTPNDFFFNDIDNTEFQNINQNVVEQETVSEALLIEKLDI